jgi:hypothetical protein
MIDDTLEILPKADLLVAVLKARFQTHIKNKVKLCQQKNMCLSWTSKNLALVAAWMIVVSHLKEDILCLDESKCLLANPISNKFLVCSNEELSYHGCYLFHNRNKMLGYEVVVPPARVELASVFVLTWSKQSVIETMVTLGSITLFHQRQVYVQLRW